MQVKCLKSTEANNVDPDQTAPSEQFDLGLHVCFGINDGILRVNMELHTARHYPVNVFIMK